jgi:2,3-bisphosphoglycerate-dependent phosphoglycerate mutase
MQLYLVRHGETTANIDKSVYKTTADHAVPLSPLGHEQAKAAGLKLRDQFYNPLVGVSLGGAKPVRIWSSPYKRTRETAQHIMDVLKDTPGIKPDYREHINLCEQQYGLFDGIPDEELFIHYPDEAAHYKKCEDHEGKFWARMPLGESRFDVAVRVHQAFGSWIRDAQKHNINHLIVVTHGVTMRAIVMQWLHLTPEWFEAEKNPANCAIRHISDNVDNGYL